MNSGSAARSTRAPCHSSKQWQDNAGLKSNTKSVAKLSRGTASKVNSSGRKSAPQKSPQVPKTTTRLTYAGNLVNALCSSLVTRKKQSSVRCFPKNDEASFHADILKIGHHGSKNSTTPDFLSAVNPQIAIISSGEGNPYGHPRPEILDRLRSEEHTSEL